VRESAQGPLRFGNFQLDLQSGELRRGAARISLQPQPFRVLSLLAAHAGRLVSREEIREQVWPRDTFVDFEQGLNYCIKQIREALGDDARSPRFIETRPRLGYRFIANVEPPAPAASERLMLAVLPFDDLSGDEQQEFFADGLTEEMIAQLSRLNADRLGVIARTSTMRYKRTDKSIDVISRELGVSYVLEGSVRRAGRRVRVTAQLIQSSDQSHVWADSYERNLDDMLDLQCEVARAIAQEIQVKLTPNEQARLARRRPVSPEAHDAYLRGCYFWNKRTRDSLAKSVASYQHAIALDSQYAAAHAGLADCYLRQLDSNYLSPHEALPLASASARRALEIDDSLAEAHTSLGHHAFHEFDWAASERSFTRAIELNAGYVTAHYYYANFLVAMGRPDEGVVEAHRAIELDPVAIPVLLNGAFVFHLARRHGEARALAERALELDPDFIHVHHHLGLVHEQMGSHPEAIAAFTRALGRGPGTVASLGRVYGLAGMRAEALKCLNELEERSANEYVSPYDIALVAAGLGDLDLAFTWLEKAFAERSSGLAFLKSDPRLDALHGDERFAALARRMNFPAA
jgi:TolB-like protein/Tfp pilus assembly protein PilF